MARGTLLEVLSAGTGEAPSKDNVGPLPHVPKPQLPPTRTSVAASGLLGAFLGIDVKIEAGSASGSNGATVSVLPFSARALLRSLQQHGLVSEETATNILNSLASAAQGFVAGIDALEKAAVEGLFTTLPALCRRLGAAACTQIRSTALYLADMLLHSHVALGFAGFGFCSAGFGCLYLARRRQRDAHVVREIPFTPLRELPALLQSVSLSEKPVKKAHPSPLDSPSSAISTTANTPTTAGVPEPPMDPSHASRTTGSVLVKVRGRALFPQVSGPQLGLGRKHATVRPNPDSAFLAYRVTDYGAIISPLHWWRTLVMRPATALYDFRGVLRATRRYLSAVDGTASQKAHEQQGAGGSRIWWATVYTLFFKAHVLSSFVSSCVASPALLLQLIFPTQERFATHFQLADRDQDRQDPVVLVDSDLLRDSIGGRSFFLSKLKKRATSGVDKSRESKDPTFNWSKPEYLGSDLARACDRMRRTCARWWRRLSTREEVFVAGDEVMLMAEAKMVGDTVVLGVPRERVASPTTRTLHRRSWLVTYFAYRGLGGSERKAMHHMMNRVSQQELTDIWKRREKFWTVLGVSCFATGFSLLAYRRVHFPPYVPGSGPWETCAVVSPTADRSDAAKDVEIVQNVRTGDTTVKIRPKQSQKVASSPVGAAVSSTQQQSASSTPLEIQYALLDILRWLLGQSCFAGAVYWWLKEEELRRSEHKFSLLQAAFPLEDEDNSCQMESEGDGSEEDVRSEGAPANSPASARSPVGQRAPPLDGGVELHVDGRPVRHSMPPQPPRISRETMHNRPRRASSTENFARQPRSERLPQVAIPAFR